jgi:hypothetical protein
MRLTNIHLAAATLILAGAIPGVTVANADSINLRTGEVVQGTFLGGTARQIRVDVNGDIRTYDLQQVQSVTFADPNYQPPPPVQRGDNYPPRNSDSNAQANAYPPPPQSAPPQGSGALQGITLPTDTNITVRMIDSVDSQTARLGQIFKASIDEPVVVNEQQVIPRGADVLTKLVDDQRSGKLEGRTVLTLALVSVSVNGRMVDVTSTDVRTASGSRGKRTGTLVGGGAALGAIVGAIAGGGKGAAIGAGSGAALGGGAEVLTNGQQVKIPSETRLTFRLQTPVRI